MKKILIRKIGFWIIDFLKGSKVRKHYKDIINKSSIDYDNSKELKEILEYAIRNVPFYNNINEAKIEMFPVMKKNIYKEQGKNCISKEYVNKIDKLYKASTSGSTGVPMIVYQDSNKKNRCRADLIRAHELVDWQLGDKYIFIRNWVQNYKQSKLKQIAQNVVSISISDFDNTKKNWLINYLKNNKKCVLFGYSSSICDFMNYVSNNSIDGKELNIKLIVCDSDELSSANKKKLNKVFGCNVINRYDNEENGLIAISKPNSDKLYVNHQSLIVELLEPENDKHVKAGNLGRVVITDLYNHAMPLIRYDTGDFAISNDNSENIKTIEFFAGRKADAIKSSNGILVSSVAISGITEVFYGINKYQLIQNSKNDFDFVYTGKIKEDELLDLDSRLKSCLGNSVNIKYVYKDEILPNKNGKFKTIINNIQNSEETK